jgi:hypothetical protein
MTEQKPTTQYNAQKSATKYPLNYIEYNQVDESKIIFKQREKSEKSNRYNAEYIAYYQYADGVVRRLYIRTPFVPLKGTIENAYDASHNKTDITTNKMKLTVDLKDPDSNQFYYLMELLDKKMTEARTTNNITIFPVENANIGQPVIIQATTQPFKLINEKRLITTVTIKKDKTEVINYNISKNFPQVTDIGSITPEKLKTLVPGQKYKSSKINPKYQKEGRFIFSPIIWPVANTIVAFKAEIKYRNQFIKSLLDKQEEIVVHTVKIIEL